MGLINLIKTLDTSKNNLHVLTDDELNKLQNKLKHILLIIDDHCRKYNINYSLSGGSMLGAVRHKGFIPWDDDIDLFMTRNDFELFTKSFHDQEYVIKRPGQNSNIYSIQRIEDLKSKIIPIDSPNDYYEGVFIDIFVLENTFNNGLLRFFHGIFSNILLGIVSCIRTHICKDNYLKYGADNVKFEKAVKLRAFFGSIFNIFNFDNILKFSDKFFSLCKNDNSRFVSAPSGVMHYFGEMFDRYKMIETIDVPFEDILVKIPKDYDYYLKKRYGENYMAPPPKDKIEKHIYIEFDLGERY